MKKYILPFLFLLLLFPSFSFGVTSWYAQNSSVNINSAAEWNDNPAGGGNVLTWGDQVAGDTFYANGKTAVAVNIDPGANGKVTLTTAAGSGTAGGGFTYATATNITINADITAGTTSCLTITGSTGGLTIVGNILGSSTTNAVNAVADSHTSITVYVNGNVTSGSTGGTDYGYYFSGTSGTVAISEGNCTGVKAPACHNNSTGFMTLAGNCVGSGTQTAAPGCEATSTGTFTVVGNLINGVKSSATVGSIVYNPGALNYISYPAPGSTTIYLPVDPGVANVKSGVQYGFDGANPLTGTYAAGGGASAYSF